jgi:eukaryotic-like serine/threonine-protein kinase
MRFLREVRLATQLDHPHIAAVCDFSAGDRGHYLVTELIDGTTLRQWIAEHGPLPVALAVDVATQILSGLAHIHERGLLHRDMSPDNIMLSHASPTVATIIDLGLLKDLHSNGASTQSGVLVGNPKYMSPEQLGILGEDEQIDARTDLYSLGAVLYEMVAGVAPFVSDTPHGYVTQHLTQMPPRLPHVPDRLEHVILRALEKDRRRRYTDANEFAAALAPLLKTAPTGEDAREALKRLRSGV